MIFSGCEEVEDNATKKMIQMEIIEKSIRIENFPKMLKIGKYMYSFIIDLPEWLPASTIIEDSNKTSKISYNLQAFISSKTKNTYRTSIPLTIFRSVKSRALKNISQIHREKLIGGCWCVR